jgi:PncC family amidohydrolase
MIEKLITALREKGLTVAFAESCTGGLLAKMVTDIPGSSDVFTASFVTYSNQAKMKMLSVSEETLAEFGAVSRQTCEEMLSGVLRTELSDLAIAVTGIAGPSSDGTDKNVGLVYIGFSDGKNSLVKEFNFGNIGRLNVRERTAEEAIKIILQNI